MEEISIADRADFAVAEKPGQAHRSQTLLDQGAVVIGISEEMGASSVAAAEAATIHLASCQSALGPIEQGDHVFGGGIGVSALKLDGLALAGKGSHCQASALGRRSDQVTNQKVTPMEFFPVFIGDKAHEQIATGLLLFIGTQIIECFQEHFISGTIGNFMNEIFLDPGDGPGFTDGCASLGNHAIQGDLAGEIDRHASFLQDFSVQIYLGIGLIASPAGKSSYHRHTGISLVPTAQPAVRIHMKRIGEHKPAFGFLFRDPRLLDPIVRMRTLFHILLMETGFHEFTSGEVIQADGDGGILIQFGLTGYQGLAGTSGQQWDMRMNSNQFQDFFRLGEKRGGNKHQPDGNFRCLERSTQTCQPGDHARFVKRSCPMVAYGEFSQHETTLTHAPMLAKFPSGFGNHTQSY